MRKKGSELQETPIPAGRAVQALLLVTILTVPTAVLARPLAQQAEAPQADAENSTRQETRSLPDLLSDNLDRVAASDVQILAVVNKEPGLLLELKRVLAQDAAMAGQVLEESELVDSAIAERLRTELRARVLATRLLQRYGFLLPRVNPRMRNVPTSVARRTTAAYIVFMAAKELPIAMMMHTKKPRNRSGVAEIICAS